MGWRTSTARIAGKGQQEGPEEEVAVLYWYIHAAFLLRPRKDMNSFARGMRAVLLFGAQLLATQSCQQGFLLRLLTTAVVALFVRWIFDWAALVQVLGFWFDRRGIGQSSAR